MVKLFQTIWFAYRLSPIAYRLSPIAYRLSPIAYRLSPIAYRLSPIAYRLSPIAYRLSPIAYRLSPIALSDSVCRYAAVEAEGVVRAADQLGFAGTDGFYARTDIRAGDLLG